MARIDLLTHMVRRAPIPEAASEFGAYITTLRKSHALSLRQVSRHTSSLAKDSAGQLSNAYLSQLEGGLLVPISLPKLLSLAAVYGTDAASIIAKLPEPLRSERLAQLQEWIAQARPIPVPPDRYDRKTDRTDDQLDDLYAERSRGFRPDYQWKHECEREVRAFLPFAALPPFLESLLGFLDEFWRLHVRKDWPRSWGAAGTPAALSLAPLSPWLKITDVFVAWAVRETEAIVSAVGLLSWWTLDFNTSGASCHFAAPALEARFGFDGVPPSVVIAVRRWQLAQLLSRHGAPDNLPPPPQPTEGVRDFLRYLLAPRPFLPDASPDAPPPAAAVCTSLSRLVSAVPALRAADDQVNAELVASVASFLNRAAEPTAPTPRRRRTRRSPRAPAPK